MPKAKAAANVRKHGVSFETAARVFSDPNALFDPDRVVDSEQRWQVIGMVEGTIMLMVAHAAYEDGNVEVIRIISARLADKKEKGRHEKAIGAL